MTFRTLDLENGSGSLMSTKGSWNIEGIGSLSELADPASGFNVSLLVQPRFSSVDCEGCVLHITQSILRLNLQNGVRPTAWRSWLLLSLTLKLT